VVGGGILFRWNLDGGEVGLEAGALEFVGLLGVVSLGDEDETVAGGEIGKSLGDAGEKLDLLVDDGLGETGDQFALAGAEVGFRIRQTLEAGDEGLAKAGDSVAVGEDGLALDFVEFEADFVGRIFVVAEAGDEGGDGALEKDVVFPEGVVGVEKEGLSRWKAGDGGSLGHGKFVSGF
jgi:hypothetical protein